LIHAAIGFFAIYRMSRRAAMPLDEQGSFVAVPPRASPVSAYLNPESPAQSSASELASETGGEAMPEPEILAPRAAPGPGDGP